MFSVQVPGREIWGRRIQKTCVRTFSCTTLTHCKAVKILGHRSSFLKSFKSFDRTYLLEKERDRNRDRNREIPNHTEWHDPCCFPCAVDNDLVGFCRRRRRRGRRGRGQHCLQRRSPRTIAITVVLSTRTQR